MHPPTSPTLLQFHVDLGEDDVMIKTSIAKASKVSLLVRTSNKNSNISKIVLNGERTLKRH